jgi:DNA polymerase-3 subunit beta
MKILLVKETLLKALSLTAQSISLRPSLPVLGNFLLTAHLGELEITATNLETAFVYKIPAKVSEKGTITAPARVLTDFCQAVRGDRVNLEAQKETLQMKSDNANASVPTINASEFPSLDQFQAEKPININKETFLEGVSQVALSAAPEEGRPVLTGVLMVADGGKIIQVTTDGYRLAKKELAGKGELRVIIPSRVLRESAKALAEQDDESVNFAVNKENNQIRLETKNLTVFSRLLEGDYPNYEQIIPNSFICEIIVDTKELIDSVKAASLFAKDIGNVVRLAISKGSLEVSASTAQVGEAKIVLSVKQKRDDIKTAFNSRFLLESLGTIKNKQTAVFFSGHTSAALLKGAEDATLLHVVMPVRAQS